MKWFPPPVEKVAPSLKNTYLHDLFFWVLLTQHCLLQMICHLPEDLKCRLKLHIGIKKHKTAHTVPLFRPENTVIFCREDRYSSSAPSPSASGSQSSKLQMRLLLLRQLAKPCQLSLGVPHLWLEHGPRNHSAIPFCSTRGYKPLGSYWLFGKVFLLLLVFMYNIWRDTICIFDLDISLAAYLNNNLKNILQRKHCSSECHSLLYCYILYPIINIYTKFLNCLLQMHGSI